jgi:hypothetical protein
MILLLVGFRQTSSDIKTRATASTKPHAGAQSLPTVNFRTNPDLTTPITTDPRATECSVPKVTFEPPDTPSSVSETASKLGGFKAEVIEFDPRVSTSSEKNV